MRRSRSLGRTSNGLALADGSIRRYDDEEAIRKLAVAAMDPGPAMGGGFSEPLLTGPPRIWLSCVRNEFFRAQRVNHS